MKSFICLIVFITFLLNCTFAQISEIDLASPNDNVLVVQDKLYYSSQGNLYSYDGVTSTAITTEGGVGYVASGEPDYMVEYNGDLYFRGIFGSYGRELLKYDIDLEVVSMVEDIKPSGSSSPGGFVVCDNKLFFLADDDSVTSTKLHLYVYDGTTTSIIHDPSLSYLEVAHNPIAYGDTLIFAASEYNNDIYRYYSGNLEVEVDFAPLNITDANDLYIVGNKLYFTGWDRSKLYVHNLTTGVTQFLWSIQPYASSTLDFEYIGFGNEYFFIAEDANDNVELFKHSTGGGVLEYDIDQSTEGAQPRNFFVWEDSLYFKADDGSTGTEMYRYYNNSVTRITDHGPGISGLFNNTQDYLVLDSIVYVSENFSGLGIELGYFDGDSVHLAVDINLTPFTQGSAPHKITYFNNKIYCIGIKESTSPFYLLEYCPRKFTSIDTTVCASFTSPSGNYVWEYSGVYVDTISSFHGCDSIITINLEVLSQNYHDFNEVINFGETVNILGNNFSSDVTNSLVTYTNDPQYNCNIDVLVNTVVQPEIVNGSPNQWNELTKLTSEYREELGDYGSDISVFKNDLLIGAKNESTDENGANPLDDAGAVYFYKKDATDNWIFSQKICSPSRNEDDYFGQSVAVQGNVAVVAAPGYDGSNGKEGAIFIYENDGIQWNYSTMFESPAESNYAYFAEVVDVSNGTIMVSAKGEEVNGDQSRGKVFIFVKRHTDQTWILKQSIYCSDYDSEYFFGDDVSIYNDYAVVGQHYNETDENGLNELTNSGAAFIFHRDSLGYWNEIQKITASDRFQSDFFGLKVSISKDKIIIGAPYKGLSTDVLDDEGAAYVFELQNNGMWIEVQKLLSDDNASDDNQKFGYDVEISGDFAVISSSDYDFDSNGQNLAYFSGAAFVFERNSSGNWVQSDKLSASDRESYDVFGTKVAICDNDIFSYSPGDDQDENGNNYINNSGSVYHFSVDVLAPIPDIASLPTIQETCEVNTLSPPTATDNDGSVITGTTNAVLPISSSQYITWTFTDAAGNESTQTQYIDIIEESISPTLNNPNLPDAVSQCAVESLPVPTATYECTGTVNGVPNVTFPITSSVTIEWEYSNGGAFTTVQYQDVIINPDTEAPIPTVSVLPDINSECSISPSAPNATDNCTGVLSGTPDLSFPITAVGSTTITWTYDDGNGNTSTQTQDVIIAPINNSISVINDVTLSADATGYSYQWVDCDNNNAPIIGETNQSFEATANGTYAVIIDNGTCNVTSDCIAINQVGISEFGHDELVKIYPNPTSGIVHIESSSVVESIELMSATGQIIDVYSANQKSIEITTAPGVYFLRIQLLDKVKTWRVVKN